MSFSEIARFRANAGAAASRARASGGAIVNPVISEWIRSNVGMDWRTTVMRMYRFWSAGISLSPMTSETAEYTIAAVRDVTEREEARSNVALLRDREQRAGVSEEQ